MKRTHASIKTPMLTFILYLVSEGLFNSVCQKAVFHTRIYPLSHQERIAHSLLVTLMKFKTAVLKDVHPDNNTEPAFGFLTTSPRQSMMEHIRLLNCIVIGI